MRGGEEPKGLDHVVEAVETLSAALASARLYGHLHPETSRSAERAHRSLGEVLRIVGHVRVEATVDGLSWKQHLLVREDDEHQGLGRQLHREGISSLTFLPELTLRELLELLDVLRINFELPDHEEETLEDLLWQKRLERIHFRAVGALREAEAISGDARAVLDGSRAGRALDGLLGATLAGQVGEDTLTRAVAASGLRELGRAEAEDIAAESASDSAAEPGRPWEVRLQQVDARDAEAVAGMRHEVEGEGDGQLLARMAITLLRLAAADHHEVPAAEAIGLAEAVVAELFRRGTPQALMLVVEELAQLVHEHRDGARDVIAALQRTEEQLANPARVTGMLVALRDFSPPSQRATGRLVERLGDSALQELLVALDRELVDPADPSTWGLYRLLGTVAEPRLVAWLEDGLRTPVERLVPTLRLLRAAGSEAGRRHRAPLLAHPSAAVRVGVLAWYGDDLPDSEAAAVLAALLDRRAQVRAAASRVVAELAPPAALAWFRRQLASKDWSARDPAVRRRLCVTFGRACRGRAVEPLRTLLEGSDHRDAEPAAQGLVAVGSEPARLVLVKGSKAWAPARKKACLAALAALAGPRR